MKVGNTKAPRIIGSGDFWSLETLIIAAEGVEVISLGTSNLANALGLLVTCYYVFNTMYPTKCANAFLFCEATLLNKRQEARKRVVVMKFISTLSKC